MSSFHILLQCLRFECCILARFCSSALGEDLGVERTPLSMASVPNSNPPLILEPNPLNLFLFLSLITLRLQRKYFDWKTRAPGCTLIHQDSSDKGG